MWANDWMSVFGDGLRQSRNEGVILTRAVWAGAARLGVVLWSSDIWSTFEELTAQVPSLSPSLPLSLSLSLSLCVCVCVCVCV